MDLSLVIPIYKGSGHIKEGLIQLDAYLATLGSSYEILAVDDGSPDDTASILNSLAESIENLQVILLPKNRGKFAALKAGMSAASGRCRIFTDADLPYELALIEAFRDSVLVRQFHLVVGDRTLPGSVYDETLSPIRRLATRLFRFTVRMILTGGLADTQCGLKAFRGDVADNLFPLLQEEGFAGDVEALYIALIHNLSIRRIAVQLARQELSTVHPVRDGLKMIGSLFVMRNRRYRGEYDSQILAGFGRES